MKEKKIPTISSETKELPRESNIKKTLPEPKALDKEIPTVERDENCITLNGRKIEIKPTKLKYFRNRTASVYSILKIVPLNEFLAYDQGVLDTERDSDQILFDFLVAVFDDGALVTSSYDDMSAEDIERILDIFGRVNHITEKEEAARKNREAQVKR